MMGQPTPMQSRLVDGLQAQGCPAQALFSALMQPFVMLPSFEIVSGRFAGRAVDLAVEVQPDGGVGSALHVRAEPKLLAHGPQTNGYNVIDSALGEEWQYWSFDLMSIWPSRQVGDLLPIFNGVLARA